MEVNAENPWYQISDIIITIDDGDGPYKCIDVAPIITNTLDYGVMECPDSHLPSWIVLSILESVCISYREIIMQKDNCHFAVYCKTCRKQIGETDNDASMMQ